MSCIFAEPVRQVQFSTVDSFARLEISEFAELRKMSAGEACW